MMDTENTQDHVAEAEENKLLAHLPLAKVNGEPIKDLPKDLYIPPEALEVFLETFQGPLDLLLYLIKKQNLDILDIPIAEITKQYMEYVDLMKDLQLELAAEYLVMAAMLAEIKSRMLLPRPETAEDEEDDPRADLVRRLQEYERFKQAAEDIDALPRVSRDNHQAVVDMQGKQVSKILPQVSMQDLMSALKNVMDRAEMFAEHHVQREPLSVRERMSHVLSLLRADSFSDFSDFFTAEEGKMGVVVTLLAVLELVKESVIELVQNEAYGPIYVRAAVA